MHQVFFQGLGETDDSDCVEWAFFYTDPTGYARFFTNRRFRGLGIDPDDLGSCPLRRTEGDAFEMTALGLTPVLEDDGNAHGAIHETVDI
jgi:hypothetical protein